MFWRHHRLEFSRVFTNVRVHCSSRAYEVKAALRGKKGIGLYTYEQSRNTPPIQYVAQIIGGSIIAGLGALLVCGQVRMRAEEIKRYGSSEFHMIGWIFSFSVVLLGIVLAHAGLIYFGRRLISGIRHHQRRFHG